MFGSIVFLLLLATQRCKPACWTLRPQNPKTKKEIRHRSRVTSGGCRTKKQMAPNEARLHYPRGTPPNEKYPNHSQLAIKDAVCRCCQCFPDPPKGRWCAVEKPWSLIVRLGHGFHQEEHSIMRMINDFKVLQVYDVDLGYRLRLTCTCTVCRICAMTPYKGVFIYNMYIHTCNHKILCICIISSNIQNTSTSH